MVSEDCSRRAPSPSTRARSSHPDLLRKERFGALYYARETCSFSAMTPALSRVLLAATEESVLDVYARDPCASGFADDESFARQVVRWQKEGVLDEAFRCRARVIDEEHDRALTGPLVTHVQLTRACNLRCTHCYVDIMAKPAPEELSTAEVLSLFAELERLGSPIVVLAGGEPMLRPDLEEILDGAARHGLDAWLCTNGTLVTEENARFLAACEGLRGVSLSLDGPDDETHDHLRGRGRFQHALRGVRRLVAAGVPDVQLRVTVTPHNAGSLLGFAPLAKELGVDKVVIKPFRQSGEAGTEDALYLDRRGYLDAVNKAAEAWPDDAPPADFGDGMPSRPAEWTGIIPSFGCVGGTTSVTVTWKGAVTGCGSVLRDDDWTLHDKSFADCWQRAPGVTLWRHFEDDGTCSSCGNFKKCGGGCRARAVGRGLPLSSPDPWAYCSDKHDDTAEHEHAHRDERARDPRAARALPIVA